MKSKSAKLTCPSPSPRSEVQREKGQMILDSGQGCPEPVLAKPKPICYCFKPIRIQNLRFYPIRA